MMFQGMIGVILGICFGAAIAVTILGVISLSNQFWDWYIGNPRK